MQEIAANEYLKKAGLHYAVLSRTEGGKTHVAGSFCNETVARDFIRDIFEYFDYSDDGEADYENVSFEIVRIVPERTATPRPHARRTAALEPYTREDIMQAVCAALLFGEDVGICAVNAMADALLTNTKLVGSATLYPGAGNCVSMSPLAAHLLATAEGELPIRGSSVVHEGGRTDYDMSGAP